MKEKPSEETLRHWHSDPNNWKFGIFYFNRADKRIFPPKKIAWMGWTVNFANPLSVLAIGVVLAFVIMITKLLDRTKH
jgi:uncharacterized membrane protein